MILKILLGSVAALFLARFLLGVFRPTNPLDAASSALRNRLFSTIKRPWDD